MTEIIPAIRDLLALAAGNAQAETELPTKALPADWTIHSLEEHQAHRNFLRLKLTTDDLNAFADYCNAEDNRDETPPLVVYDAKTMTAEAIFDVGTAARPGHQHHRAKLNLAPTAVLEAVLKVESKPLDQDDVFNWLIGWSEYLQVFEDRAGTVPMDTTDAASRFRSLNISETAESSFSEEEFAKARSKSAKIEMRAREQQKIPARIDVTGTLYRGLPEQTISLHVQLQLVNGEPALALRWLYRDRDTEIAADGFEAELRAGIHGVNLYRGAIG